MACSVVSVVFVPGTVFGQDSGGVGEVVAFVKDKGSVEVVSYSVDSKAEQRELVSDLRSDPSVKAVDVGVNRVSALADPYVSSQWAASVLDFGASRKFSDGSGVTVAVLDTGVDYKHKDLVGAVDVGRSFSLVSTEPDVMDLNGHGTHVAGIVAAQVNGKGVEGLAPGSDVVAVKVLNGDGEGDMVDVAEGIVRAADLGVDVINMSLGTPTYSTVLQEAVDYAVSKGCVVVAAAGNSGHVGNVPLFPAAFDNVVAVGATAADDSVAYFSNYGDYVDLAAPGQAILSSIPYSGVGTRYAFLSGTSMAAPYVSASVSLVLSAKPSLSGGEAVSLLEGSAEDIISSGVDDYSGYGRVVPAQAVSDALGNGPVAPPAPWSGVVPSDDNVSTGFLDFPEYRLEVSPINRVVKGRDYWSKSFEYVIRYTMDGEPVKDGYPVSIEWSYDGRFKDSFDSSFGLSVELYNGEYVGKLPVALSTVSSHQVRVLAASSSGNVVVKSVPVIVSPSLRVKVGSDRVFARIIPNLDSVMSLDVRKKGRWVSFSRVESKAKLKVVLKDAPRKLLKRSWRVRTVGEDVLAGNPVVVSDTFKFPKKGYKVYTK